jgi:hypothetical protein
MWTLGSGSGLSQKEVGAKKYPAGPPGWERLREIAEALLRLRRRPVVTPIPALGWLLERACGFDRSELYSDEGPPIGEVATEFWPGAAFEIAAWVLRWN